MATIAVLSKANPDKVVLLNDPGADKLALIEQRGLSSCKCKKPTLRQLEKWSDAGMCPTPDGCRVEPDGKCQHGWPSWMLILGVI